MWFDPIWPITSYLIDIRIPHTYRSATTFTLEPNQVITPLLCTPNTCQRNPHVYLNVIWISLFLNLKNTMFHRAGKTSALNFRPCLGCLEALNLAHDVGLEAHLLGPNDVPGWTFLYCPFVCVCVCVTVWPIVGVLHVVYQMVYNVL